MNKKRLSVVMAGAMLASSVAPVLAAEVQKSEVSAAELGLLIKKVRETLDSKKFANETPEDIKKNTIGSKNYAGESVYYVKINGKEEDLSTQALLQEKLGALTAGSKVEIFSKGFRTETVNDVEKYYAANSEVPKYEKATELEDLEKTIFDGGVTGATPTFNTGFGNLLNAGTYVSDGSTGWNYDEGTGYNEVKKVFVLDFKDELNARGIDDIELKVGDEQLNLAKYIALNNTEDNVSSLTSSTLAENFKSFAKVAAKNVEIPEEKVEEITIISGGSSYKVSDLYDGLMLTENGKSLLKEAKAAVVAISEKTTNPTNLARNIERVVKISDLNKKEASRTDFSANIAGTTLVKNVKTGEYNVKVEIADSFKIKDTNPQSADFNSYYISGTDIDELKTVLTWLNAAHAQVDVLAGEDRYETAVEIAKETAKLNALKNNASNVKNIVLVNGNSLVDGLAAAPLAESLAGADGNAPILLTETNELPRATREYLIDLADEAANKTITVSIVGGKGVVSNSIKSELIRLGFKVDRFGGDDREETSMAVAEKVAGSKGIKNAFVVGATGEADAMSIAGYAASQKTPIIVSGFEGLSEGTLDELRGAKATVLGGNASVSEADYKELSNYIGVNNVRRISGEDRKATNAAIINEFYSTTGIHNVESVVVAKDDVLIDALTAANLASEQNAPLVLATNSLSSEQVNALELKAKSAKNVYQVGYGVDTTNVLKVVAQRLGLAK